MQLPSSPAATDDAATIEANPAAAQLLARRCRLVMGNVRKMLSIMVAVTNPLMAYTAVHIASTKVISADITALTFLES
jgi:hypothetical protein